MHEILARVVVHFHEYTGRPVGMFAVMVNEVPPHTPTAVEEVIVLG
ncbi:hypothetical protein [uncultured Cytophaga sp.]|nr:hypothetical protein [uncultured Cytophaga sp.]